MDRWTLRLGCLLAAAALIAGCGTAQISLTTHTTARAGAGRAHGAAATHRRRAQGHASSTSRFPASVETDFRRTCAQSVRQQATHVPAQYRDLTSVSIDIYCTCALQRVEASVGVDRFKHDIVEILLDHTAPPRYMLSAEGACSAKLQSTLSQLEAEH